MRTVYYKSNSYESQFFGDEISVTHVRTDELDSDAILRAMELCGPNREYYIKEHFEVKE